MITMPAEIARMIKTIEDAGFEAYAVGGCVRDSILGRQPEDWDLTSNASRDTLEALFPDASIVNKKLGVMRISEGGVAADVAAYRIDGAYIDYRRPDTVIFTDNLSEDLRRRDFTMNAIAFSPTRGVVDPFHGREDIQSELIRGIGDPQIRFEEDALRILRAVRFAAQLGFRIESGTLQAMEKKAALLRFISVERIREELIKIITAPGSGTGLSLFAETGALPYVLSSECAYEAGAEERNLFAQLANRIHFSENDLNLRLALLYRCFERNRALGAIGRLRYSREREKLLQCAVVRSDELEGIRNKPGLKSLLCEIGTESVQFLTDLLRQRCKVYELDETALHRVSALLDEIQENKEPVFPADLAVTGGDLIASGMKEGTEIGRILQCLLAAVHQNPEKNEKTQLLKLAAEATVESLKGYQKEQ